VDASGRAAPVGRATELRDTRARSHSRVAARSRGRSALDQPRRACCAQRALSAQAAVARTGIGPPMTIPGGSMFRFAVRGGLAASAVMLMISFMSAITPALASGTLAGAAQIVDGTGHALAAGDSNTDFAIKLPSGASCP